MELSKYFQRNEYQGGEKSGEISSRVDIGHGDEVSYILVQSRRRKNTLMEGLTQQYNRVINIFIEEPEKLEQLNDLVVQSLRSRSEATISGSVTDVEGNLLNIKRRKITIQ